MSLDQRHTDAPAGHHFLDRAGSVGIAHRAGHGQRCPGRGRLPDPLSLAAAIETLRITPDCSDCHQALRAQLWRALLRPLPQVARRNAPDAMGQRYLDALEATP